MKKMVSADDYLSYSDSEGNNQIYENNYYKSNVS